MPGGADEDGAGDIGEEASGPSPYESTPPACSASEALLK